MNKARFNIIRTFLIGIIVALIVITIAVIYTRLDTDRSAKMVSQSQVEVREKIFNEIACSFPESLEETDYLQKIRYPVSGLDQNYIPDDLVSINRIYLNNPLQDARVRSFVEDSLTNMLEAAALEGVTLRVNSAFRAYDRQASIFNNPINNVPGELALAARPGYSEHQLGTTIDVSAPLSSLLSVLNIGYQWIEDNSYKYGFILTYPDGSQAQTGFRYEPWHIRYVGTEIAQDISERGVVYNELDQLFLDTSDQLVVYNANTRGLAVHAISESGQFQEIIIGEEIMTNKERSELFNSIISGQKTGVQKVGNQYIGSVTIRGTQYQVKIQEKDMYKGYLMSMISDNDITAITKLSRFAEENCKVI